MCSRSRSSSVQSPPAGTGMRVRDHALGQCLGSMICAGQRMVARSMALRSSRMLPGHG